MATGFAAELWNPLTSIKTFVQLVSERRQDAEFIDHFSRVVSEDVGRIERLIHEILDYSKYMKPRFTKEDLNDVVGSCVYFIEVKAGSMGISIQKDLADGLPRVVLDRQQIKQVICNLFLNAIDAMKSSGGLLSVATHPLANATGDPWVQIEVRDTGCGISEEDVIRIFDPFYTTKHKSGEREGAGLGLAIVNQIVHQHRGYVEVKSQVGRGTTLVIHLPVTPTEIDLHCFEDP
jgi:signal transduction histidine kinase